MEQAPTSTEPPEGLTGPQVQALIKAHRNQQNIEAPGQEKRLALYQNRWGKKIGGETEGGSEYIETNYPGAYVDTMIANVVPPHPEVTVNARNPENDQAARNREGLVSISFEQNKLHERLWLVAAYVSILRRAFLKLAWDRNERRVKIRVVDPRYVFFDQGADCWEEIGYIMEAVPITKQDFMLRVKKGIYPKELSEKAQWSGFPSWAKGGPEYGSKTTTDEVRNVFEWTVVYEVYDLRAGVFYHVLPDVNEPLVQEPLPHRWLDNPFGMLTFTDDLEGLGGISDVEMIYSLLEQLNELDTLELNFVKTSITTLFINKTLCHNPEEVADAYANSGQPGAIAQADIKEGVSIRDVMMFSPLPSLSPNHSRMQGRIEDKIAFLLAFSGYQRGDVGGSDVATAYALADAALRTRNGRRQKKIYDLVSWAAKGIVALYEQYMPAVETLYVRLAGRQDRQTLTRNSLGFVDPKSPDEHPLAFDYDVVPYSALESNKLVQTKQIEQFWPYLQYASSPQVGLVDPVALNTHILDVLGMPNVAKTQAAPPTNVVALPDLNMGSKSGGTPGVPATLPTGSPKRAPGLPMIAGGPGDGGSLTE